MAVVAMPHYEPWIIARWAFDLLMSRLLESCSHEEDKVVVQRAIALSGLHLDLQAVEQQIRLAKTLAVVTDQLRFDIESGHTKVSDRDGLVAALAELEMRLHDLFEPRSDGDPGPGSGFP